MKEKLKSRSLSVTGRKMDLVTRLKTDDEKNLKFMYNIRPCKVVLQRIDKEQLLNYLSPKTNLKENTVTTTSRVTRLKTAIKQDHVQNASSGMVIGRVTRSMTAAKRDHVHSASSEAAIIHVTRSKATRKRDLVHDNNDAPLSKRPRIELAHLSKPKDRRKSKLVSNLLSLKPALQKYEMVWAHIRGFANWPGIIEEETVSGKYRIHFFGDYTKADVTKGKIMHLLEGFNHYTTSQASTIRLTKAIKEAQLFIFDVNRSSCPICDMLKLKLHSNQLVNNRALLSK